MREGRENKPFSIASRRRRARRFAKAAALLRQGKLFAVQVTGHLRPIASRLSSRGRRVLQRFVQRLSAHLAGLSVLFSPFKPILSRIQERLSPLTYRLLRSRLFQHSLQLRKSRLVIVSLFIVGTIASFVLPALQVHAASLTWTNNSDFSNNQISRCQSTTLSGVVVTGAAYGDPSCAASGEDSSLQLDSAPNYFTGVASVSTSTTGTTVALKTDGTVWAWGLNNYGQLGNGTTSLAPNSLPVQVKDAAGTGYLTDVKQVIADKANYVVALKTDGTVWSWGYNNVGQLGNGTTTASSLPVQVKDVAGTGLLAGVSSITTSNDGSTFALMTDGTVFGWGYNNRGQLGYNSTANRSLPIQVKDTPGTGYLTGVASVTSNAGTTVALKTDGTVWAWGYNNYGQLGVNNTTQRTLPIQVKDTAGTGVLTGVSKITNSGPVSMAIMGDGAVYAWGYNNYGQLGVGDTTSRWLPAQVKDNPGTGVITGITSLIPTSNGSTLALRNDGTVWGWGYNNYSQLGDGGTLNRYTPNQVKNSDGSSYLTDITNISMASNGTSMALKSDGTVWGWGYNNYGQLGDNSTTTRIYPVQVKDEAGTGSWAGASVVTMVASGTSLALNSDGTVAMWGYSDMGRAGTIQRTSDGISRLLPDRLVQNVPTVQLLTNVKYLASGSLSYHSLALKHDGTVWAWGDNGKGQLGDGTVNNRSVPVQVRDSTGSGYLNDVTAIAVGRSYSFAIKKDGTLWAWGLNIDGNLGDGTSDNRYYPVQVKNSSGKGYLVGVTAVAAGLYHSAAVAQDGSVWVWGRNPNGEHGDGSYLSSLLPTQVKDPTGNGYFTGAVDVAVGERHTIALNSDGTVWAWGRGTNGEHGDGKNSNVSLLPVQVKNSTGTDYLKDVQAIDAGVYSSYALKMDGTVWGWGWNSSGQLGNNSTSSQSLPAQVVNSTGTGYLSNIVTLDAGNNFAMAIGSDGTVWSWGANSYGKLGDGTTSSRTLPVQAKDTSGVSYINSATDIAANEHHSSVLAADGTVLSFGYNAQGQLGDNTIINRSLPTQTLSSVTFNGGPGYATTGTGTGYVVDAGQNKLSRWADVSWHTEALPADTSVVIDARYSVSGGTWSDWTTTPAQSATGSTSGSADLSALPYARYLELRVTLTSTGANTPTLTDFTLNMVVDNTPPVTNATNLSLKRSSTDATIPDGSWTNASTPYAEWTAATDNQTGSGVTGYCLYLGQDNTADLMSTKGLLGTSPLDSLGLCPFAVSGTNLDLSQPGMLGTPLTASTQPYYLLVKAFDAAHNLYDGPAASYSFKYDNDAPTNLSFVSLPSTFIPTKDVTITWPTSGSQTASDATSGLAGIQYRIGDTGTWQGLAHNGQQDSTDVIPVGNGNYQTDPTHDYPLLADGNNMIYFRAIDNAGNVSSTLTSAGIKINSSAPSSPQSVTATPTTNTSNSFAFSWQPPATFVGTPDTLTYCYTVNTLPTTTTCSDTTLGQTSLNAGAYATQPGDNTFYVVARDQAGNINYATAASVTFTANTPAPGLPINIEIADVSVKATSNWKLALSWEAPTSAGAGVANYRILRSTSSTSGFAQIATTAGLSYVDTGLTATTYYYRVKACDSANNCGAPGETVSLLPTGRFTTPAELIGAPSVVSSTRRATIDWTTARGSDSRIQYGTESGKYQATEAAIGTQTKTHSVDLTGLEAGTTYYYRAKWTDEDGNVGTSAELSFTTLPAPKVKDVKVTKANLSGAIIQFTSTDAAKVSVYYGKTEAFGGVKTVNTSRAESSYTLQLDGLDDGATYYYRPDTIDADDNTYRGDVYTFTTPPRPTISGLRFQPVAGEPTSTQLVSWTTNVPTDSTITYGKDGTNGTDVTASKLVTAHELTVRDLEDESTYFLVARSRDADGNLAVSDKQTFKTALDTRPPKVSDLSVETAVKGNGTEARSQVIVSWKTDEPATSQVAYGQGSDSLTSKTAEDTRLTRDHIVIISDLAVSKVYYVQPISKDKADNQSTGTKHSAIIGRPSESVLNIIMNSLNKVFGW